MASPLALLHNALACAPVSLCRIGNSLEKNARDARPRRGVDRGRRRFPGQRGTRRSIAVERGWHRLPSFHRELVAGVGTYALELLRAAPAFRTVYVPIGLGSGACGVSRRGTHLDTVRGGWRRIDLTRAHALSLDSGTPFPAGDHPHLGRHGVSHAGPPALDVLRRGLARKVVSVTTRWKRRCVTSSPTRTTSRKARAPRLWLRRCRSAVLGERDRRDSLRRQCGSECLCSRSRQPRFRGVNN